MSWYESFTKWFSFRSCFQTLSYLKKAVLSLSDGISNGFSQCLMSGLLSSRLTDVQPSSLTEVTVTCRFEVKAHGRAFADRVPC